MSKAIHFPEELWAEVLARLPVKSLLRFRCVSRFWCTIIDNPKFIPMHRNLYKNNLEKNYLLFSETKAMGELKLTIYHSDTCTVREPVQVLELSLPNMYYLVKACVDGLLLIHLFDRESMQHSLMLWNPSIRRSLILPPWPLNCKIRAGVTCALGFSHSTNDCKVLACQYDNDPNSSHVMPSVAIYELSNGIWRTKTDDVDVFPWWNWALSYRCYCSKGAAHWLARHTKEDRYTHILSFDFDAEEFSFVELPDDWKELLLFPFLLGESVAVLGILPGKSCIWVMDKHDGKEEWSKWFSGDLGFHNYLFFYHCNHSESYVNILYVEKSDVLLIRIHEELMSYDIRNDQMQELRVCGGHHLYTYVESLLFSRGSEGQSMSSFP